jgi:hypothetical protein
VSAPVRQKIRALLLDYLADNGEADAVRNDMAIEGILEQVDALVDAVTQDQA